jgi:hypothetical protein
MKTILKLIVKLIFYIGVVLFGPFVWLHKKYTKRKSALKYKNIVDGFTNHVFPNPHIEDLAKTRASICSRCPYAKNSTTMKKVIVDNKTKEIQGMYCDICGCSLSAKVRSNDYCPKGRW